MLRILTVLTAGLLCLACDRGISSYEEGIEAQNRILMEMVTVLEDVDDQASAETAASRIESLGKRLAEVSAQTQALPPPSAEQMEEVSRKQRAMGREFQKKAATQMMKLAEYEVLSEAWRRAMANTP